MHGGGNNNPCPRWQINFTYFHSGRTIGMTNSAWRTRSATTIKRPMPPSNKHSKHTFLPCPTQNPTDHGNNEDNHLPSTRHSNKAHTYVHRWAEWTDRFFTGGSYCLSTSKFCQIPLHLLIDRFWDQQYTDGLLLPSDDPYYPWEHRWINRPDTIPRYMRAAKWKFDDAKKRIKGTLEWRRDFKPDLIPPDEVRLD